MNGASFGSPRGRAWLAGAVALAVGAGPVAAGPHAEAIARHAAEDVAALRAQLPGEPVLRCTLGAVYAQRADLPRAMLYLAGCEDLALPADVAPAIVRAAREVKKRLRASELTELQIITRPAGMRAELDALPGETLTTPATVWVAAGSHTVRATAGGQTVHNVVRTRPYSRSTIFLEASAPAPAAPQDQRIDFEQEQAGEAQAGPPPDIKRPSLVSARYLGIPGPRLGPPLEDPLARRPRRGRPRPWFGVRLGGGVFDDATTSAAWRPALSAAARFAVGRELFLAARLDWSRRGGAAPDSVDSLGAGLGAGTTLVAGRALALAAIGQLRGDLRFADARATMPVARAGVSAALGLELALVRTPITAGLRLEHGLTRLVDSRDRAVVLELGVDWR